MKAKRIAVVGGGAAGFFAAIACAEADRSAEVVVLEKGPQFLTKVRISGGGRCNVTHGCFGARELTERFPRGEKALIGPFHRFQARDTVEWFEARGVRLKTEPDGRVFPVSDSSQTIIDCLLREAEARGVKLLANHGVEQVERREGVFHLGLSGGASVARGNAGRDAGGPSGGSGLSGQSSLVCDRLLLATGGCRTPALGALAVSLGHTLEPPVPSLFTFHIEAPWVRGLAGLSVPLVEASVPGTRLRERGPLLFTHVGVSGPVILRLSAWGARELNECGYQFPLLARWLPELDDEAVRSELRARREAHPARTVANGPIAPVPARLWGELTRLAGIPRETRWAELGRAAQHALAAAIAGTELRVSGKSLNKEEFVTCGGVRLGEVNFKTMESRICPGLFFAGELLDLDGITGGFNFQAAWTTGWLAGRAMAEGELRMKDEV